MNDTQNFAIWKPEHDGHAPPNWREGMDWAIDRTPREQPREPRWMAGMSYWLPPEALNSPNDDASGVDTYVGNAMMAEMLKRATVSELRNALEQRGADELAAHGITLAPERDWATELWADLMEASCNPMRAIRVRDGRLYEDDRAAIELLRTRFEQMKGEG